MFRAVRRFVGRPKLPDEVITHPILTDKNGWTSKVFAEGRKRDDERNRKKGRPYVVVIEKKGDVDDG